MSQRTEQVEESSTYLDATLDLAEEWYHVPLLAVLVLFMLWVRLQKYERFIVGDTVYFSGNDPWYHLRQVTYTVNNWPSTMPFDPWTYFPYGTSAGQFGTLYDQLIATAALVVGLGSPSQQTIGMTLLVAPAVFGALVAVPTYLIGKRLGGRLGGVFGVLVLALLPGVFLGRGLVGAADHNVAEPLFQSFAVLATMVAVTVAEREKPVYELVADRDVDALHRPLAWSILAGIALALYLWTWPPGILLTGILGVFYLLALSIDYARGVSPDHLAFVAAVSMGVAGLLMLVPLGTVDTFSPTSYSLVQPFSAFAIAVGSVFMAWLARTWDDRDLSPSLYPVVILGILAVGVLFVYLLLPGLYSTVESNLVRFVGFGAGAAQRTIGEAQPMLAEGQGLFAAVMPQYGLTFFTAAAGALVMLWRYLTDDRRAEYLLVLVWSAFITSAAFTQVRFNYYLVVPVAVLNAYLVGQVLRMAGIVGSGRSARDIEGYQIMAILLVFLVLVPVLVVPVSVGSAQQNTLTAVDRGTYANPGAVTQWDPTLQWMQENTPAEGTFAGANNEMAYNGTFSEDDGDYDYPEGAYGVMSWWDYGHWITVRGERIPNANPFQQGAETAANFLLAPTESEANQAVDTIGDEGEETRYVMVDWKMVSTDVPNNRKFFAPTAFKDDVSQGDYYESVYTSEGRLTGFNLRSQNYYESQMVRLYHYHGSAYEPQPIVLDWDDRRFQTRDGGTVTVKTLPDGENESFVRTDFRSLSEAREYVEEDGSAQVGGLGSFPSERVPALEHYRLVRYSQSSALNSNAFVGTIQQQARALGVSPTAFINSPAWVKLFERVPGATVEGTAPEGSTVTASVEMRIPSANSTFTYRQQAEAGSDGTFTMTLPYSSTGADQWGTEQGYTNTSVRATGPYEFRTEANATDEGFVYHNATADVSEAQVIGEDDSAITVDVDNRQVDVPEGANNSSADNSTSENATAGNSTGNDSTTNDSAALDRPDAAGGQSIGAASAGAAAPDASAPADAREAGTGARAGLVGAYAAAVVVASRD